MTDHLPIGSRVTWRNRAWLIESRSVSGWARINPELAYITLVDPDTLERITGLQQCDVVPVGPRIVAQQARVLRLVVRDGIRIA